MARTRIANDQNNSNNGNSNSNINISSDDEKGGFQHTAMITLYVNAAVVAAVVKVAAATDCYVAVAIQQQQQLQLQPQMLLSCDRLSVPVICQ